MRYTFRYLIPCLVLCLASALPAVAKERRYSEVIAFGDSLSDPGNAFYLTGQQSTQPFAVIPSFPYAIGGHHFSNGRTWVEQLGRALRLQRSTGPAIKNPRVHSNYAVGGSRARDGGSDSSASVQVMQFFNDRRAVPGDALVTFVFGGNDVRDALAAGGDLSIIGEAVTAIAGNLIALCDAGAKEVIVGNSPDLGATPAVQALDQVTPGAAAGATALSAGLNLGLADALNNVVQPSCPGTTFHVLDTFSVVRAVFEDPGALGFVDARPCLTFDVIGGAICRRPNTKFFWDGIHPTRAGHALFAETAAALIAAP